MKRPGFLRRQTKGEGLRIAGGLGEGHRIIRGVAGSGKDAHLGVPRRVPRACVEQAGADPMLRQRHRRPPRGSDARTRRRRPRSSAHVSFLLLPDAAHSRYSAASESEYCTRRLAACVRIVDAEVLLGHIPGGQYDAVSSPRRNDFRARMAVARNEDGESEHQGVSDCV